MSEATIIAIVVPLAGGAIWLINLMIDNKVLTNRVHDLEKENEHLREYAKISKP